MKGLSFALMTSSWKADTLFGVSVSACIVGVDAAVEVVIVGTAGGSGGSGGDGCDEGELYSASPEITGFDSFECRVADGSRTRGKSAMSSKRDAAASRLNKRISWFHRRHIWPYRLIRVARECNPLDVVALIVILRICLQVVRKVI
jgi:hypothetical protein